MFFDINEIQNQVGVLFNNEKCIVFNSSSSQKHIFQIYTQHIFQKKNPKTECPFTGRENQEGVGIGMLRGNPVLSAN